MSTTQTGEAVDTGPTLPPDEAPLVERPAGSKLTEAEIEHSYGLTDAEYSVLLRTVCKNAPREIAAFFMLFCKNRKLDPFSKQVYLWPDKTDDSTGLPTPGCNWNIVAGIDGLRAIASRSKLFRGSRRPVWTFKEDKAQPDGIARFTKEASKWGAIAGKRIPIDCEVVVLRAVPQDPANRASDMEFFGIARFDEFVKTRNNKIQGNWENQPEHQLRVRAEAMALRMAFPEEVGGIYTEEELRDGNPIQHEPEAPVVVEFSEDILALATILHWERPMLDAQLRRYGDMGTLEKRMRDLVASDAATSRSKAQHKADPITIEHDEEPTPPGSVAIHTTADKPAPVEPEETFESANFDPAPGSVTQRTLGILYAALARRGVSDKRDRHYWAVTHGFTIAPYAGGKKAEASYSNLSEAEARAFVDLLTVRIEELGEWRDRVVMARCIACGASKGDAHRDASNGDACPMDETNELESE